MEKIMKKWLWSLAVIYLVLLTWIILFKMSLRIPPLGHYRMINMIPFADPAIINGKVNQTEQIYNFLIFVPVGIYLSLLFGSRFLKNSLIIAGISLFYEVMQYILGIGATDVTDLLLNTAGGIAGLFIFWLLKKLLKKKTEPILLILATVCTILFISLFLVLFIANHR